MKYLISFLFFFSASFVFGQQLPNPQNVSEGQPCSFQTTETNFASLVAELGVSGERIDYKNTTWGWFTVNGSFWNGQHATFLLQGKAITVWLSETTTQWVTCPNVNCQTYKGKWAGVTVGKLKT